MNKDAAPVFDPEADKAGELTAAVAEIAKAQMRNPLLPIIEQLRAGRHYMNAQTTALMLDLIPPELMAQHSADDREKSNIETLLAKLSKMVTRLEVASAGSSDTKELKDTFTAMKDMVNLVSKLKDEIDTEKHLRAMEEATVAAFDEIQDEEIKKRFVLLLEQKLERVK